MGATARDDARRRSHLRADAAGRVIALPQGATPVDFAYHLHSELGHRCRGRASTARWCRSTRRSRTARRSRSSR
ncbi:TGS domain-containing protein [Burkholderia thailandensis]|uniref:TGS domain-containing protein n=1 Tax=Burkholderia thailandensis TaxID=57975 RepID=UPI003B58928D